jgi:HEAT repeat protein
MPFLIEHIIRVVFVIFVVILLGNFAIIGLAISRRQRRERYFQRIDALRAKFRPVVGSVLAGRMDYQEGLSRLKEISGLDRLYLLEQLLLEKRPSPAEEPILRQLCEDLGLVRTWQNRLVGQVDVASVREAVARPEGMIQRVGRLRFLIRAKSAENLGIIHHRPSWPLLVKALDDPHPDLQSVASRALAVIREPESFSALVAQLHKVVLDASATALSLRSVKSALVSFPLQSASGLLPSLHHPNLRIRFLATDIIREMVLREAKDNDSYELDGKTLGVELMEACMTQLPFDENPDVRARSTEVITYLSDARSAAVLLTLLRDSVWFVRLHAVRALARRKFLSQAAQISEALSDPNWRVREAAVATLRAFGSAGLSQLTNHFINTDDTYSQEQVADEFQRAGLIPDILQQYAGEDDAQSAHVLAQMARLGKTSYVLSFLSTEARPGLRKKFLRGFGTHSDPQIQAWVQRVAASEPDVEVRAIAEAALTPRSAVGER